MFVSPESPRYSTFWRRVGSAVVDSIIFWPLTFLTQEVVKTEQSDLKLVMWNQFANWALLSYIVLMHGTKGQTLGKMVCKVKVLDVSEAPLSMFQAMKREVMPIVLGIIVFGLSFSDPEAFANLIRANHGMLLADDVRTPEGKSWYLALAWGSFAWFILEIVTMLASSKRRALHDFIAGSVVVRTSRTESD